MILLDMNMPKKNGLQFCSAILIDGRRTMFPVLILTGRGEFKSLFDDMDVVGFVEKPIAFNDLINKIDGFFNKSGKQSTKVLIVENDDNALAAIMLAFIRNSFVVSSAASTTELAEKIGENPPQLLLIKLANEEMASDLRRMGKIKNIPTLLYIHEGGDLDKEVIKQLCSKSGINLNQFVRSDDPAELLDAAKKLLGLAP